MVFIIYVYLCFYCTYVVKINQTALFVQAASGNSCGDTYTIHAHQ